MEQIINRKSSVRPLCEVPFGSIVLYQDKLCLWDYTPKLYPLDDSAEHMGITVSTNVEVEVMMITKVEAQPLCVLPAR